ncbi:MAG TPA: hypothetical protein ENI34_04550 [candidate division WOR-3 bacterium]|uniref:Uncharacterized protein n=1 Tax=candidate division WOR-3 bacterium TaxID=2052148 RepID=A0A9C9EMJ1_UNCW3|nr:hypothetical protein [candidate division WOR-3 bacterium]
MIQILIFVLSVNPFYKANFTSLSMRSISVFSNPAGLGIHRGAESFSTYHPDITITGASMGNLGFGMTKIDSIIYYEIGVGLKLPGAFSLGYAYQFDIKDYGISSHIFGFICRPSPDLSLGYKTTLGSRYHMFGGISIKLLKKFLTLSCDIEYEGINDILNYYYGAMIQPLDGVQLNYHADKEFNWNAGTELTFGKIKLAGKYSSMDKKFSGGIILSAQSFKKLKYDYR